MEELEKREVIKRKRKITSCEYLLEVAIRRLLHSLSFRRLSLEMSSVFEISVSSTDWRNQLNKFIPILFEVLSTFMKPLPEKNETYLIDATEIPIERGKGYSARLHTSYCLANNMIDQVIIGDWHIPESLCNFPEIHANALYMGDRAYGHSKQIAYLIDNNADCLLRISPSHITIYEDSKCKHKIDFTDLLSENEPIDKICYISYLNPQNSNCYKYGKSALQKGKYA